MTIHIESLTLDAIIGILEHERNTPQKIIIDMKIKYRYKKEFLDYALIANSVVSLIEDEHFFLVEDALNAVSSMLCKKYKAIKTIKIKITKPDILTNCTVGVSKSYLNHN
jgi:dihydroneopterin aldolase